MEPTRFDTITRLFASRKTRRAALQGTGIGLAAAAIPPLASRVAAQEATPAIDPNDPHPSADDAQADPEFLFVQPFDAGTWAPKDGEDDTYTLTLTGAAANTVYFSDRPERIFGVTPNQKFLDGLGFTPDNPPNAAVVALREGEEDQEVLVIELLNPAYDSDSQTLTYDARVLSDYGEHGLAHAARQQQDYELGETFAAGSLFIDGCPEQVINCADPDGNLIGAIGAYICFSSSRGCFLCDDPVAVCGSTFPACTQCTQLGDEGTCLQSQNVCTAVLATVG